MSGLISSAFYALVPAYLQDAGTTRATIALFMLVAVLGGLAFQVPVGWLSDRFDRRLVLAALGLGFAAIAVILVRLPRSLSVVLPTAILLGGFMSTLYPVCVSYAHDRMPADRVVAVSGRLILLSGLGSVVDRCGTNGAFPHRRRVLLHGRGRAVLGRPGCEPEFDDGRATPPRTVF